MNNSKKVTVSMIKQFKLKKDKIPVLTCYDYSHAKLLTKAGVDVILVGDSLGMVVLGYDNTLHVTMEDMIRHTSGVRRGAREAFVIADMPYMSYHADINSAVINAGKLIVQGGADAVKIEGGKEMEELLIALKRAKIPVVGHIGLTPQSVNVIGGYKYQGKNSEELKNIIEDAKTLEDNGAIAMVLECIPQELAKVITDNISIATIGIGSGKYCDGQVLVLHDMLGMYDDIIPNFVKKYGEIGENILDSISKYSDDVKSSLFPCDEHGIQLDSNLNQIALEEFIKNENNK